MVLYNINKGNESPWNAFHLNEIGRFCQIILFVERSSLIVFNFIRFLLTTEILFHNHTTPPTPKIHDGEAQPICFRFRCCDACCFFQSLANYSTKSKKKEKKCAHISHCKYLVMKHRQIRYIPAQNKNWKREKRKTVMSCLLATAHGIPIAFFFPYILFRFFV